MLKIVVPTDFSPNATRAIDYAVQLAKTGKASVMLINACDQLGSMGLEAGLPLADYNQRITEEAFANLGVLKKSIEETEHIKVETELFSGTVVDTVVTCARDTKADLIIMGTMGINSVKDSLFGTNTSAVMAHSTVPVLAIPLEFEWRRPKKFLLAINNFEEATDILKPVFDLARIYSCEVDLVVFTDEDESTEADFVTDENAVLQAEADLKKIFPDIVMKAAHLSGHQFEATITAYTEKNNTDLLAMTTHKRSLIGNIFNRSITRKMSYHSKVPVLAIPVK
jgi:nucleotide-binding universal stress UspA family protein